MAENSVSYSQFSMYMQCPRKWELEYIHNNRSFEQSIHTIFGTAMHETLQNFPTKQHELVGIEIELKLPLKNNVTFKGFIDIVIKDNRVGRYKVLDFKTSTRGWNKYQKADKSKTAQLILYKEFYARQLGIDPELIDVEYIILRRKINEDSDFPMKRIQTFAPASGKPSRNKIGTSLVEFVGTGFNEDGTHNKDVEYPAYKSSSCKYCKYKDNDELCPAAKRMIGE